LLNNRETFIAFSLCSAVFT